MARKRLHEPWQSLLEALDRELASPTELHCFGSFVVAEHYGLARATADVDVLESRGTDLATIARLAGKGSSREDLVLAKLGRNIDRDREDVVALARGPGLDIKVLRERYREELRPKLGRPERDDLTLALWSEMIAEIQSVN